MPLVTLFFRRKASGPGPGHHHPDTTNSLFRHLQSFFSFLFFLHRVLQGADALLFGEERFVSRLETNTERSMTCGRPTVVLRNFARRFRLAHVVAFARITKERFARVATVE